MNNPTTSKALGKSVSGLESTSSSTLATSRGLRACYLLLGACSFLICGIAVTYTMTVCAGHVDSALCFISYTGNYPPESSIFSFIIGISALIYFCTIYVRFVQISHVLTLQQFSKKKTKRMNVCNATSLAFGELGAFGLGMTGFFQHFYFHCMHLMGVILCFYFSYIFFCMQLYFMLKLDCLATSPLIKFLRIFMVVVAGAVLSMATLLSLYNWTSSGSFLRPMFQFIAKHVSKAAILRTLICIEWILFIMYQIILFSFYPDLKKVKLMKDRIVFID